MFLIKQNVYTVHAFIFICINTSHSISTYSYVLEFLGIANYYSPIVRYFDFYFFDRDIIYKKKLPSHIDHYLRA